MAIHYGVGLISGDKKYEAFESPTLNDSIFEKYKVFITQFPSLRMAEIWAEVFNSPNEEANTDDGKMLNEFLWHDRNSKTLHAYSESSKLPICANCKGALIDPVIRNRDDLYCCCRCYNEHTNLEIK